MENIKRVSFFFTYDIDLEVYDQDLNKCKICIYLLHFVKSNSTKTLILYRKIVKMYNLSPRMGQPVRYGTPDNLGPNSYIIYQSHSTKSKYRNKRM